MQSYHWYKIINKAEFEATGLVSKTVELIMEAIGKKEILVTQGNYLSLVYEGVMLPLNMEGHNPFEFEDLAVYLQASTDDIYLGIKNED